MLTEDTHSGPTFFGRSQNDQLHKVVRGLKVELQDLTKSQRPLELEITRLKADVENQEAETRLVGYQLPCNFSMQDFLQQLDLKADLDSPDVALPQ